MFTKKIAGIFCSLVICCASARALAGDTVDCNGNGTPDAQDIAGGASQDCQPNGIPDECDISGGGGDHTYFEAANLPIPGNNPTGVSDKIFVPEGGVIEDVDVALFIDHDAQGDLMVTLEHRGRTIILIHRPGSNAEGCGPSIYGYFADDFGSAPAPLVLDDSATDKIDCYAGPGAVGTFGYAGLAEPTHALSEFNGMDPSGDWTLRVSDHLFYNFGTLVSWSLSIKTRGFGDCNENGVPDDCDIASGSSPDANGNHIPDECETRAAVARLVSAESRRDCDLLLTPGVRSEPRRGGATQLRAAFDQIPMDPTPEAVILEQRTCAAPQFVPYTGSAAVSAWVVEHGLVLSFSPGLENARTYRVTFDSSVTGIEGESFEFRVLFGDANGDGWVNATDRSYVVGQWQGGGFSCATDMDNTGFTTATDRSMVISAWTGTQNCAP